MRVSSNSLPTTLVEQLNQLSVRQQKLQAQAATGQRIQAPSDDPDAVRRVLNLQAEGEKFGQYEQNIIRQQELGTASYTAMQSLKKVSDRANEIATRADGLKSPQELKVLAGEITQLLKSAVNVANAKNRGDFLFAGTKSDQPPFVLATNASGVVTGVTYQGNEAQAEHEISEGVTFSTQVPGANTTGSGALGLITDSRTGADLFNHLIALQNHLLAGDTASVAATDRAALAKDEDGIVLNMGTNAAMQSRLETEGAVIAQRKTAVGGLVSNEVDADLATTLVNLTKTQNAYQVALQSGATVFKQSLMDYLR